MVEDDEEFDDPDFDDDFDLPDAMLEKIEKEVQEVDINDDERGDYGRPV